MNGLNVLLGDRPQAIQKQSKLLYKSDLSVDGKTDDLRRDGQMTQIVVMNIKKFYDKNLWNCSF